MDRIRKFLGLENETERDHGMDQKRQPFNNKPRGMFTDESDADGDMFNKRNNNGFMGVRLFTNPLELQKQIETQMEEMLKQFEDYAGDEDMGHADDNVFREQFRSELRDREMKPDEFKRVVAQTPIRSATGLRSSPGSDTNRAVGNKLSDEDMVMSIIHGTQPQEDGPRPRRVFIPHLPPGHPQIQITPFNDGGSSKTFRGITQITIRRPDGTTETKKIIRDQNGNVETTISTTRPDGMTETRTFNEDGQGKSVGDAVAQPRGSSALDKWSRNLWYNPNGYALPKNLW